jgi:hypothetical protein
MSLTRERKDSPRKVGVRRIPQQSLLYARVIPLTLILIGVVTLVIVVFAMGLVFGVVPFK